MPTSLDSRYDLVWVVFDLGFLQIKTKCYRQILFVRWTKQILLSAFVGVIHRCYLRSSFICSWVLKISCTWSVTFWMYCTEDFGENLFHSTTYFYFEGMTAHWNQVFCRIWLKTELNQPYHTMSSSFTYSSKWINETLAFGSLKGKIFAVKDTCACNIFMKSVAWGSLWEVLTVISTN